MLELRTTLWTRTSLCGSACIHIGSTHREHSLCATHREVAKNTHREAPYLLHIGGRKKQPPYGDTHREKESMCVQNGKMFTLFSLFATFPNIYNRVN